MKRYFLFVFALVVAAQVSWGVEPSVALATYYAGIDGKATDGNDALRVQLCTIISTGYISIGYSSLPNSVYAASSDPSDFYNGNTKTMEDIYSSYAYTSSQSGSSATDCGKGWNKEHTVPQSYFAEASPMVSDAHHVFPTDIRMNSCRSNYPYGENAASKYCESYGYGHLGTSTFEGYSGTVFDPGDGGANGSYKGDLARVYFYMVTRYRTTNFTQDNQHNGAISFTYSNGVADLTPYMKNLMLKWHREDPVSEKELIRNNAIYAHQHNRNPFVDYPCLVEYIWGEHKGESVELGDLISGYAGVGTNCCSSGGGEETPIPADYYTSIEGLKDSVLKSTLGKLTYDNFTTRYSYGSGNHNTWHALWSTDRDTTDNSVIDMYSNNKRYFNPNDTTESVKGCDIEHMFPNSWWGAKAGNRDAYEDLHHLVPADFSANRSKSNRGPGVPTDTTFNNGVWVNGNDANRDGIEVFCPSDEYKGDFARAFFYIATTYGDTAVWQKEGITGNHMTNDNWQEFKPAMRELLLTWHRNDPVSDKERVRAQKVYEIQGNRNPFIDYPCLAEYIWGDRQGETVVLSSLASAYDANFIDEGCTSSSEPNIIKPTNSVYVGITNANNAITKTINVRGINLTSGNLTLALSGTNAGLFSLSSTSISSVNASKGQDVTITYTPTANGNHHATLTISGCGVSSYEVALSGTCSNKYTATWKVEGVQTAQTTAFSGQMPSIPTSPANCEEDRVFVGWTAENSVSDRPADLFVDESPALTANTTFYAVFADEDKHLETSGSKTYIFSSNKWAASPDNWINGKSGYSYVADRGVQVSKSVSGAFATAPIEFANVTTIKVYYCTNPSAGAGSITMYVDEESKTKDVTKEGGTTIRNLDFDFSSTRPSGEVTINAECTTNSIYIDSITISYCAAATYSNYKLICSEVPQYTLTFNNNGNETTITDYEGTIVNVEDAEPCDGAKKDTTFYGWGTAAIAEATTIAPSVYASNAIPAISGDATYYAVYKYEDNTAGTPTPVYVKVTSTSDIEDGQYLIVYKDGNVALDGGLTDFDVASNTIAVTINNDTIASSTTIDAASFTIAAKTGGYSIKSASNYYIGHSGSSNTIKKSTKDNYVNTLSIDESGNFLDTCNAYVMKYNTSAGQTRFRYYNSTTMKLVQLYKRVIANISSSTTTYYTTTLDCSASPTGIEETEVKVSAQKVLIGGQLFILREGKLYDARGQRVK